MVTRVSLIVSDVNEDQEIDAPEDPAPFDELVEKLPLELSGLGEFLVADEDGSARARLFPLNPQHVGLGPAAPADIGFEFGPQLRAIAAAGTRGRIRSVVTLAVSGVGRAARDLHPSAATLEPVDPHAGSHSAAQGSAQRPGERAVSVGPR